uniref:LPD23 domain-containing protein n=1 Tax=Leyella stercorea TaxID=363265 RepID=UPI003AF087CE
ENTLKAKIEAASADVNTEPTEAQKEAGNYKKGHVQVGTFDITIEQPEGSIRRGTDADGKKWEIKMHNTYGYFRGTEGVDGDHIDVFLSNDIDGWNGRKVFVVDQYNPDGTFDEHKVMLGFNDMDEAKSDYLANYEKGWENGRRITVSTTNLEDFEKWIDSSHRKTKPFSEYSSVNKETVATDKGGEKAEKKQKKQSVFDKAKEIADKEEKKRKAEAEDDSALGQATRAVGKKKKVNLFKYTASEIISYPTLRGVHYANGYAYASDGYILFKEKADYPKEWEGTTRDKDGNLIDGKYPDTEKAIHRLVHIPDKEVESLPSKEVLDFAIAASKKLKGEAIPVAIDGLFFNAVNLKKFLEAVASKGMDKIVYRHPMLYATNGKDEIVMMPTVNTLEGALDIADKMESAGLPKEQIDAWKAHIEAADKEMSLEDFKKAVENAKKKGDKAESPKQKELTEAERKDAEEVAGALGYRVEWVDTMEENGTIDADRKVIRIAKDAENPLVQVLGHEVAHGVKRMDGGKFRALQKAAKEVVGEKEWNERIEKKRKLNAYAEGKLAEEVTCDIVGEALNNKDALKRLAESLRGERSILARLRDAVARMVEYFKNRGDKDGVRRMKAADKLLAEFESALKEDVAPEQVKPEDVDRSVRESRSEKTELTAEERELRDNLVERMRKGGLDVVTDSEEMQRVIDTENERTRNMFVGEKGATEADKAEEVSTRLDNLSVARRMEEAKKDAKTIKMATGWERGSDGKWRYETSDIKPKPFEKWMNKKNLKLGDIIDSDSGLFEMYPELKDFKVTRGKGKSTNAAIYTGLGKIEINFSKFKPYMSIPSNREKINGILHRVINHEIQHAIQDSEGFAQGVSPNAFRPDAPIGKLREMEEADGRMVERYNAMSYTEKALGEGVRLKERILENRKEYNALASKYRFGMDGYTRAAGEVEARNTEKRIGMTEEERRASLASETEDVAREDQILLGVDNADGEMNTGSVREHRVYHGSGADFDAFDHSHMGEGEGAQAYGWGTYVTEVEGIGKTYAIQNTTKHNDALRALQHDVDAISDQLNRHRDDLKYDEEQLKRANEWRAEAELDYELFRDEAEELKEKYGESSPEYRNHLFNDIYTDEMKRAQSSVKSTEESIQYRKEKIAELEKALKDKQAEIDELPKEFPRHLYTVEIPDDNGSNYLDWNGHPAESLLKDVGSFLESEGFERVQDNPARYEKGESTVVLNPNATGADLYAELREALGSDKKASQALAELGCIGIKYPADNMRGGRKDGAKNYVIFNENDAKITDHTRFLRTADG